MCESRVLSMEIKVIACLYLSQGSAILRGRELYQQIWMIQGPMYDSCSMRLIVRNQCQENVSAKKKCISKSHGGNTEKKTLENAHKRKKTIVV